MKPVPNPVVSCLIVTQKGRGWFLTSAVRQFEEQRYLPRELVIVTNAPEELPPFKNSAIRVYPYPQDDISLGELRTFSVEQAQGDVIAVWDDDDVRHPNYLASQVSCLGTWPIVMLPHVVLQCSCGEQVVSNRRTWECTMIARKEVMVPYQPLPRGEDSALLADLRLKGHRWTFNKEEGLYTKKFHGNNAWNKEHNARLFLMATPPHTCQDLDADWENVFGNQTV
jgi:glycosyltransferase involved in cell wall biosynthesis